MKIQGCNVTCHKKKKIQLQLFFDGKMKSGKWNYHPSVDLIYLQHPFSG